MSDADVLKVLTEIIEILNHTGYPDQAAWLAERETVLAEPRTIPAKRAAERQRIRKAIEGLNVRSDYVPMVQPNYRLTAEQAKERIYELTDRLYEVTN